MTREKDDYTSDMEFGKWLRDQRICAGFSLEEASKQAGITPERLKGLEMGLSERGVNASEAERICSTYRLVLRDFLERATG